MKVITIILFTAMFLYLFKFQLEPWVIQTMCENMVKCDG